MDLKRIFLKDACPTSIGGQAIMEGIMMRGPKRTAIAIRLPNGKIHLKTQPTPQGNKWGKIPFVRGVINFVASLVYGTKVLMYSADGLEFYRRIIAEAPDHLKKAGVLMMEIGYDQKEAVKALLRESGRFEKIVGLTDLTGKDRIVAATVITAK